MSMTSQHSNAFWSDEPLPLRELVELSGLSEAEVRELVDYGVLTPADEATSQWVFSVQSITIARTARRLREDFELDPHGVALLLAYLDRIHELEAELCALRAQLPR
jgi:ABC-type taurine transport system substrate-binding protein